MKYAQVKDGQVERIGLPTTGILTQAGFEECSTSEYDKLPYTSENPEEPTLQKEGWLPIEDNPPAYDPATQYLGHTGYTVSAITVTVNYDVKQLEPVTPEPTAGEKIAQLEADLVQARAETAIANQRTAENTQNLNEFMDLFFSLNPDLA